MNSSFINRTLSSVLPWRKFIFIPLFLGSYLTFLLFQNSSYPITSFIGRSISKATFEGIDITTRVSLYYKGLATLIGSIAILALLTLQLIRRIRSENTEIINALSLAGFCLMPFLLFGADLKSSIHLIFALQGIALLGSAPFESGFTLKKYLLAAIAGVCFFFLQWQLFQFLGQQPLLSMPAGLLVFGLASLWTFIKLPAKFETAIASLSYIPLLSFLAVEGSFILNQHSLNLHPAILYLIGIILIIAFAFRAIQKNKTKISISFLFSYSFPLLILAITILANYQPVVHPEIDWFEHGNKILPLHQWFQFGKVPFINTFNSHAISDFGFGALYSLFNGKDPAGVYVYGFLMSVTIVMIYYFLIYKISGNGFLALWLTLFYPYAELIFPGYYNLIPLSVLALIRLNQLPDFKNLLLYFLIILFMLFWRIDLGISNLVAGAISFLLLFFTLPDFKPKNKDVAKAIFATTGIAVMIFIIALIIGGASVFTSIKDALAYLSSMQSYGVKDLSKVISIKYYCLYFIFPTAVFLILIYAYYGLLKRRFKDSDLFLALTIMFFGIFYISNLQRGLVRHTLAEQWDTAFTSFAFFIITGTALWVKDRIKSFLLFFVSGTVILLCFLWENPELTYANRYTEFVNTSKNIIPTPSQGSKNQRIIFNNEDVEKYSSLSKWLNANLTPSQTFVDFSNTPMMYYFCNRMLPNYLCQIPHTAHNDYLQTRFLQDLKNYDAPVVLFSNVPETFWDNLDGIPNTIRHYRISEYIYQNYHPALTIDEHAIWLKNNFHASLPDTTTLKQIGSDPQMLASSKDSMLSVNDLSQFRIKDTILSDKSLMVHLTVFCQGNGALKFTWKNHKNAAKEISRTVTDGKNEIHFPLTDSHTANEFTIQTSGIHGVKFSVIRFIAGNYLPDFNATAVRDYNLHWIPFTWGSYDVAYTSGKIQKLNSIASAFTANADQEVRNHFNSSFDKTSGNYVHLRARTVSDQPVELIMNYGKADNKLGGFTFTLKNDRIIHDYLIRVSSQYLWNKEAVDYLSIYPIGHNVEVESIELLKGD